MTSDMDVAHLTGAHGRALSQTEEFCCFCSFKSRNLLHVYNLNPIETCGRVNLYF